MYLTNHICFHYRTGRTHMSGYVAPREEAVLPECTEDASDLVANKKRSHSDLTSKIKAGWRLQLFKLVYY